MSPRPDSFSAVTGKSAWSMSGMRVRVIRFQSSFSENGITGWMTSLLTVAPSLAPPYSSRLYCNGTLISEATGFASFLASSAA